MKVFLTLFAVLAACALFSQEPLSFNILVNQEIVSDTAYVCQGVETTFELDVTYNAGQDPNASAFVFAVDLQNMSDLEEEAIYTVTFNEASGFNSFFQVINGEDTVTQNLVTWVSPAPVVDPLLLGGVTTELYLEEELVLPGTLLPGSSAGASWTSAQMMASYMFPYVLYLPDGSGENYETSIAVDLGNPDLTISSAEDIDQICIDFSHSYAGDLEMWVECPNGQIAALINSFSGSSGVFPEGESLGGYFFGNANDNSSEPAEGFVYCFGQTATDFIDLESTIAVDQGIAFPPGFYLPAYNLDSLVGCPVDGEWKLLTRDNLGIDDGWIYDWGIGFNGEYVGAPEFTDPVIEAYWNPLDGLEDNGNETVTFVSETPGEYETLFVTVQESGCVQEYALRVVVLNAFGIDGFSAKGFNFVSTGEAIEVWDMDAKDTYIVQVFSLGGQLLDNQQMFGQYAYTPTQSGVYTLQMTNSRGQSIQRKFAVLR